MKNLKKIFLGLTLGIAFIAFPVLASINISSNFSLNSALPIETSMVVADITARNAISTVKRFEGMISYVVATATTYQLQGGIADSNWIAINSVGTGTSDFVLPTRVATTAVLPGSPTYSNGSGGVGATLTRGSNGTLGTIDGITPFTVGDRILVKNQASALQNGVYEVTTVGGGVPYVLTRTTDSDATAEFDDQVVAPALGTANVGSTFGQQTISPVVGTNSIVYTAGSVFVKQQSSGTQTLYNIPWWTSTSRTLNKGTTALQTDADGGLAKIRGVPYTWPSSQGASSTYLGNDGSGNLSWNVGSGIVPALPATHIAFGDGSDLMTSSNDLTWDDAIKFFQVKYAGSPHFFVYGLGKSYFLGDATDATAYLSIVGGNQSYFNLVSSSSPAGGSGSGSIFAGYSTDSYGNPVNHTVLAASDTNIAPVGIQLGLDATNNVIFIGDDLASIAPVSVSFRATAGLGSDIAAANLVLDGGPSTGSANPGKVLIRTSTAVGSGTTAQTLATRGTWDVSSLAFSPYGTSTGNTYETRWLELAAGGSNYVGLKAPDAITTNTIWTLPSADSAGCLKSNGSLVLSISSCTAGGGTVTSVGFTGGLISVANPTTTPAFTVAGTSGGIPYFSSTSTWASSGLLAANALMIGGGAGATPATTTTGSGILTWLGTPSSANLITAVTDETGSGALVFGTAPTFTTSITMADAANIILNTTTGTKFGTSTSQKLAFFNSSPIVKPSGSIITALSNLGLVTSPTLAESEVTFTDITTNNVSTSAHGYAPKGDGSTYKFLNANGAYSTGVNGNLVYSQQTVNAGDTIANQSGSDVAFTSSYTIPANTVVAGSVIKIEACGVYGTNVISPTIIGKVKLGSTTVATTGTVTAVAGVTNGGWCGFVDLIVLNAGASGSVESQGYMEFATAATTALSVNMSNTAAVTSIDFTATQTITVTVNWGTSNAANTITLRQLKIYNNQIANILGATAGGDLSGTYPNPTVAKINTVALGTTTATSGNLLIGSGTAWVTNAMSGDITINSTGVTAIGTNKVTYAKFQQGSAYTFLANNTAGTANFAENTYHDSSIAAYSGTIAWTCGAAPSSTTNHAVAWTQIGGQVTINLVLTYATGGTTCTAASMVMPAGSPTPNQWAGLTGTNNLLYPCFGYTNSTPTGLPTQFSRGYIFYDGTNYLLQMFVGSSTVRVLDISCTYRAS